MLKKVHQFYALYFPPNSARVNKSRRTWAGNVARMGESRNAYRVLVKKNLREEDHF
jgi:hypothetical protein